MDQKPFDVVIDWDKQTGRYEGRSRDYGDTECGGDSHEEVLANVKAKVEERRQAINEWGRKAHVFNGWDWTELAEYFEVQLPESNGIDEYDLKVMQEWLCKAYGPDYETLPEVVDGCRRFLAKLIEEDHSYQTPLWQGLAAIKHDSTFMRMFVPLLGYMWT